MSNSADFPGPAPDLPQPAGDRPAALEQPQVAATSERSGPPRRGRGAPRGNTNAAEHGLHILQRRFRGRGKGAIDGRSTIAVARREWLRDVLAELGEDLTAQERTLLDIAANTWLMIVAADTYIAERGPLIRRKGALRPVVEQRGKLVSTLRDILRDLGLKRRTRAVETLEDFKRRYESESESS